jgi:hypothetical protein
MWSVWSGLDEKRHLKCSLQKMVQWGNAARLELLRPINRDAVLLKQYKLYLDEALSKDLVPLPNELTIVDVISGGVAFRLYNTALLHTDLC